MFSPPEVLKIPVKISAPRQAARIIVLELYRGETAELGANVNSQDT